MRLSLRCGCSQIQSKPGYHEQLKNDGQVLLRIHEDLFWIGLSETGEKNGIENAVSIYEGQWVEVDLLKRHN